jgi:Ca-activated chloride channel homolog
MALVEGPGEGDEAAADSGLARGRETMTTKPMSALAALAALRIAAVALSALAILDVRVPLPSRGRRLVALIDVSDSVGAEGREKARAAALSLIGRLGARDRIGVVAFSADARVLSGLRPPAEAARILESADLSPRDGSATDIALGVATAASLLPDSGAGRTAYLFSDGRPTRGAGLLPPRFARSGIRLDAYPVGERARGVAASGLELPQVLRAGERAAASWLLEADEAASISWTLSLDGRETSSGETRLAKGENRVAIDLPPGLPGTREVSIQGRDAEGRLLRAAASGGLLAVGGPAQVLVIGAGARPSPLAAALRKQGIEARAAGADGLPETGSGYSGVQALVLDDVSALDVSEAQQAEILAYVSSGGGLLVVGGEHSLGRGEYFATPLEDMLPVSTDTRRRLLFTRSRILFVIDNSGSMSELVNGVSKQMAAMRGVANSLPDLGAQDEVGILSFDETPTWVLPFTPADRAETILESMTRMRQGGGTDLARAVEEVATRFSASGPTRKHAVILTDGLTLVADFERLSRSLNAAGVTVSTVGVGETVNEELLKHLAEWNGGTYYRAEMDQVPRILSEETVRVTRDLIQEGSFALEEAEISPASAGIAGAAPRISGYLVTRAKPLARVLLTAKGGETVPGEGPDPLLATWRYGAGKVTVFASDSGAKWLSAWSGTPSYSRLWAQAVRDVERGDPDSRLAAGAYEEGGALRITVEAQDADGRAARGLELQGRGGGASSPPFALRESAPGRYEALVPAGERSSSAGLERFTVRDSGTGAWTEAWAWRPRDAELSRTGPDAPALAAAAAASGGTLSESEGPFPPPDALAWRPASLRFWLILASLLLFVAELYGRSTFFGQLRMAKATMGVWWSLQKALADRLDDRREAKRTSAPERDDSAKVMDAYRRLAQRSLERSKKRGE